MEQIFTGTLWGGAIHIESNGQKYQIIILKINEHEEFIFMKEIKKQIKEKSFYKVYLLTGDEPYLILQAKHMLKNGMIREGDTMNYAEFTDAKVDINTLQELAFTYPFFSEKRLLLLDGTGILKTGKDEFVKYYG